MKISERRAKRWHCVDCAKQYCFINSAIRHNIRKHANQARFRDLQELVLR